MQHVHIVHYMANTLLIGCAASYRIFVILELYRMKICMEFNIVTWMRMVKFRELNIANLDFLNVSYFVLSLNDFLKNL